MSLTGKSGNNIGAKVVNDGFWPNLQVAHLLNQYRIPAEYQSELTMNELELATINVNDALERVKEHVTTVLSFNSLSNYCSSNDSKINDEYILIHRYKHAVFCYAKARLLQHYQTINRRKIAENEAKESDETEQYWLDESQSAIAAVLSHFYPDESQVGTHGAHVVLL